MNYQKLIKAHRDNDADITVAVHNSSRNQDPGFGSFRIDSKNRVVEFVDQPQNNHVKKPLTFIVWSKFIFLQREINLHFVFQEQNSDTTTFPSMGIYVINRHVMTKLLTEYFPTANDLRCEVIPQAISMGMNVSFLQRSIFIILKKKNQEISQLPWSFFRFMLFSLMVTGKTWEVSNHSTKQIWKAQRKLEIHTSQ